jgi:CheY-like chemotaxis protein
MDGAIVEKSEVVTVLIAEDDDGHADLVKDQLWDAGVRNPCRRFRDGQELWSFLNTQGRKGGAYVILLDIRMPRMDGIEVLRKVKADSLLSTIPIIMLTTTDDSREIEACYLMGCNCYVTKPVEFKAFSETLRRLGLFIMIMRVSKIPAPEGG